LNTDGVIIPEESEGNTSGKELKVVKKTLQKGHQLKVVLSKDGTE